VAKITAELPQQHVTALTLTLSQRERGFATLTPTKEWRGDLQGGEG